MRLILSGCLLIVGLTTAAVGRSTDEVSLKRLYDARRWFDLRDAIQGKRVSALYDGAIASAFNRVEDAERNLNEALRGAPNPEAVHEVRGMLALLYIRIGRSGDAGRLIDDLLKAAPQRSDIRNMREVFGAFADKPDQVVRSRSDRVFPCEVTDDGVHVPLSINGKSVTWLLDTGANITMMSEAEARMAGLRIVDSAGQAGDLAGGSTTVRTSRIGRLRIGATEVRNVPVILLPDTQQPFVDLPPGRRGVIGLPVALALQAIRWTKSGTCQTGFRHVRETQHRSNLAFDQFNPLVRVDFDGRPLDFLLDTGNQRETQLWEPFARDFAPLVKERGTPGTRQVTQIGGSNERPVMTLPEVRLGVGGLDTVLRPATVFSKPVGNDFYHGNLGMDLLSQASEVTIDFRSMSLRLR